MARRWLEALQLVIATPTVSRDTDGRLFVDFLRVKDSTRLTFRVGVASIPGAWDWTPAATETVSVISTGAWTERVRQRDLSPDLSRFLQLEIQLDETP
jgi:hypothetical protein